MSVHRPTLHDCAASNCKEISKYMPLNRWKALKAALIAVLITAIAIVAIVWQGDPTAVGIAAIVAVLVAAGANVKEVEIARALTITFRNGKRREPRDDQDQE